MSYTKGPWMVDPDDRPGMEWNNHIISKDKPYLTICFMTHDGTKDNLEGEANAKLIAAAPDLLEAAIEFAEVGKKNLYPVPDRPDNDWAKLQRLIAAIEKATK